MPWELYQTTPKTNCTNLYQVKIIRRLSRNRRSCPVGYLDIKRGRITKNIVKVLKNDIVILLDKKSFCEDYNIPLNEFDEIYNYIKNNGGWKVIGE